MKSEKPPFALPESLHLDGCQFKTDLDGLLSAKEGWPLINLFQYLNLLPIHKKAGTLFSRDIRLNNCTYRIKARFYQDHICWQFTDITDLVQRSKSLEKDGDPLTYCKHAWPPAVGEYPKCLVAENEVNLRLVMEESQQYIAVFNEKLELTYFNQRYAEAVFANEGFWPRKGSQILKLLGKKQASFWRLWFERVQQGEEVSFEVAYQGSKGEIIYLDNYLKPLLVDGTYKGIIQFTTNITERKKLDQQLRETEERLRMATEAASMGVFDWNEEKQALVWGTRLSEMFERDKSYFTDELKQAIASFLSDNDSEKKKKGLFTFETRLSSNGKTRYIRSYGRLIFDYQQKVERVIGISTDQTLQKMNELQLLHSLEERDILLKEIHHRVKNNLQIISSILYLKSSHLQDADSRLVMEECNRRIRSMHMIHEQLLREHDLGNIQVLSYLESLIREIYQTFRLPNQKVDIQCHIEQLHMGADKVMTVAMIIYELLSNALLHAFKGRDHGRVSIELKGVADMVDLCIRDNGIGLPDQRKWEDSLGILLVKTFATQLKAKLSIQSEGEGSNFCIQFKQLK